MKHSMEIVSLYETMGETSKSGPVLCRLFLEVLKYTQCWMLSLCNDPWDTCQYLASLPSLDESIQLLGMILMKADRHTVPTVLYTLELLLNACLCQKLYPRSLHC